MQLVQVAATTGNDPELDSLILRLHTETACRRAGALALRPQGLDPVQSVILLREKAARICGNRSRHQAGKCCRPRLRSSLDTRIVVPEGFRGSSARLCPSWARSMGGLGRASGTLFATPLSSRLPDRTPAISWTYQALARTNSGFVLQRSSAWSRNEQTDTS
ncbi:hypothetical protein ABZ413_25280 [Nocardia rhamnosiphila]|uniref:hypothetical protein n=1 Tax=Nocardia rhamnosiphila TaxID=426716 RepID=UPI0033E25095